MKTPDHYKSLPWADNVSKVHRSGRVLVGLDKEGSRLDFFNNQGSNLPAYLIYIVLKIILGADWVENLEGLHRSRSANWKVEVVSTAEAKEYRLYTIQQNRLVCSSYITISDGQIHSFSILPEDSPPLLKQIIENYPPVFFAKIQKLSI